ncbi:MAG: hypothetical protein KJ556_21025 [Gammaproteobacteria bacterium]|nr:hypothetical protein [Gammaproteobacteria bacterium]
MNKIQEIFEIQDNNSNKIGEFNGKINNWELDYRQPPYEDCTDGNFLCEKGFVKGTILNLTLNQTSPKKDIIKRQVKVVASFPEGTGYKNYFDILEEL